MRSFTIIKPPNSRMLYTKMSEVEHVAGMLYMISVSLYRMLFRTLEAQKPFMKSTQKYECDLKAVVQCFVDCNIRCQGGIQ